MQAVWEMDKDKKVEVFAKVYFRIAEQPDGVTMDEFKADGIISHSSVLYLMTDMGLIQPDRSEKIVKWKLADGND